MSIRVRRPARVLPEALRVPGSDLDVLIDVVEEAGEHKFVGFRPAIREIQRTIHGLCAYYSPSLASESEYLCRSGEINGNPFRGSKCFECRVGQFSPSGFFTGEITGPRADA